MKIYGSAQYIQDPEVGDLQLEVNSQWDFGARDVCFQNVEKSLGAGKHLMSYDLREITKVKDAFIGGSNPPIRCKRTATKQAEITPEIVKKLEEQGYSVHKKYKVT
jgi:hypothetical protein